MKERFEGESGRRLLIDTIKEQKLVAGDSALASEIASIGEVIELKPANVLIKQGHGDNDLYLIVAGSFNVVVNGRLVAKRSSNDHVGEMSAIQPTQLRAATLIAAQDSVVIRLSEGQISDLGDRYPSIWRCFAKEISRRLEQRNQLVNVRRNRAGIFVISSKESLDIARAVQNAFEHDPFEVVVWTNEVFTASEYPLESLEAEVAGADFAIAVVGQDDMTESRGARLASPRDNVIFEIGYFMGALGRKRTFVLKQQGVDLKMPSDLLGLTPVSYRVDGEKVATSIAPACNKIRTIIQDLGSK